MAYERYTVLVIERSVRDFQSKISELNERNYYLMGSLVVTKKLISLIPFRLENEYCALMQKTVAIEEKKENDT